MNNLADARWNIETFWQLEQWLSANSTSLFCSRAHGDREARHRRFVRVDAFVPLTGEEMLRMLYPGASLWQKSRDTLETAVMNDVPGFAWYVPQALREAGSGG